MRMISERIILDHNDLTEMTEDQLNEWRAGIYQRTETVGPMDQNRSDLEAAERRWATGRE